MINLICCRKSYEKLIENAYIIAKYGVSFDI